MSREKRGLPKYVEVYNRILKLISDGTYPEGGKLPTENELSAELNVSRMTLRQSLLLLKEDGIIETIQGSGNYVKKAFFGDEDEKNAGGLEKAGNIIEKVCEASFSDIEYEINLAPAGEYTQQTFQRKTPVVVEVRRTYKNEKQRSIACSLSMILTDVLEDYEIDLNDSETIRSFLETITEEKGHYVRLDMKITSENELVKVKEVRSELECYLIVVERVYDIRRKLVLHSKYYIPAEQMNLKINWYNK